MSLLVCLFYLAHPITLEPTTTFQLSDTVDHFIQNPLSFDIDSDGRVYLVDGEAQVVFVWDKTGKFLRTIGKPGQGPGEFSFSGRGRPMGYIYVVGDSVYVFDGIQRKISVFDNQGTFKESLNLNLPRARTQMFAVIDPQTFLLAYRRFNEDHFMYAVKTIDAQGKDKKVFKTGKDNTVSFSVSDGRPTNFTVRAYNAAMVVGVHAGDGRIFLGDSSDPKVEMISADGAIKTISPKIVQRDVTEADKEEFNLFREQFQRGRPVKFLFPEKMPFYSKLFPLENNRLLVFNESPYTHKIEGVVVDFEGKIIGQLTTELGEGGGLLNARGRLLMYTLNEDDEFEFSLVEVQTP